MDMRGVYSSDFFHVCTDGTKLPWMFQDDQDFILGMNRVGICAYSAGICVVSFILMDNHVHFLLEGTMPACKDFINKYKSLTGRWIRKKYGLSDYLHHLPTNIIHVEEKESLMNTIAYIDRNALVAGYPYLAGEYPWGSARYVFRDKRVSDSDSFHQEGNQLRPLSEYSRRMQRSMLGSAVIVPRDWLIDEFGMLDPRFFVDIPRLESIYKSSMQYSYFLAKRLEGVVEQSFEGSTKLFFRDKELRQILHKLVQETYGHQDVFRLGVKERLVLARKLRYNYASTYKQIARILHVEQEALEAYL
ncbi:MAG: hypothetical protein J6U70_05745 [Bacteroidales bacterium]|nr:hypothetical protein [Bacteroidales bacterium]